MDSSSCSMPHFEFKYKKKVLNKLKLYLDFIYLRQSSFFYCKLIFFSIFKEKQEKETSRKQT